MAGPQPLALEHAVTFLREQLAAGDGEVPAAELLERAGAAGISSRTMNRARAAIGCRAERRGAGWVVVAPTEREAIA